MLKNMIILGDIYPSPFRLWLGNRLVFVITDADHIETILLSAKALEKEELYKFLRPWMGTGLLTASGAKWRSHRKLIMPTFNQRILNTFVEVFAKQSELMIKNMTKELNRGEFNVFNYASLANVHTICETVMGVDLQAQSGQDVRYVDAVQSEFENIQNHAMMTMKTLLSTVLRRYILKKDRIVDPKDIELKIAFMLKTVEPLTLRIVERTTGK